MSVGEIRKRCFEGCFNVFVPSGAHYRVYGRSNHEVLVGLTTFFSCILGLDKSLSSY